MEQPGLPERAGAGAAWARPPFRLAGAGGRGYRDYRAPPEDSRYNDYLLIGITSHSLRSFRVLYHTGVKLAT